MSAFVKVFGCRPHDGGAAHTGAGVRKPPREETAGGVARSRVKRYGDFVAGGLLVRCIDRLLGKLSRSADRVRHPLNRLTTALPMERKTCEHHVSRRTAARGMSVPAPKIEYLL
jgi:hypothetical protein